MKPEIKPDMPEFTWQQEEYLRRKQSAAFDLGVVMGVYAIGFVYCLFHFSDENGLTMDSFGVPFCALGFYLMSRKYRKEGIGSKKNDL